MRSLARLLAIAFVPFVAATANAATDAVTLLRSGLGAEALAASGVTPTEVTGVIADVAGSSAETNGDLATADAAFASAKATSDALARLVRSGNASAQEKADYQSAKTALAQAVTSRQAVLDALFAAGITDLSAPKQATLTQLRANNTRSGFPVELLVVSRTDTDWIDLREALQHEKVCIKDGETIHPTVSAQLAAWRSASAVANAKANLDSSLVAVMAAWDSAAD